MKKILLFISFLSFTISCFAQTSVLGIKFGESYSSVLTSLENRYGKYNVFEEKGNLRVYEVSIGDYTFNSGHFEFQYSGNRSYFYYANFQKNYNLNEASEAKKFRENLKYTLEKKYVCDEWTNDEGYKCYAFADLSGTNVCYLTVTKSKSKGGQYFIYVMLDYGPFHYIDETSDF